MAYSEDLTANMPKTKSKKLTKLFIYNNAKKHWVFCKDAFKQLFNKPNQDQFIKLISFMISDFNCTLAFLKFFKKDLFQYEFDNEISVYAFFQEFLSGGEKTNCFLFVHVPKEQINHPNIQSIFYQIYTFLYLICDLTLVHLSIESDNVKVYQINFVQNVINLSNLYLKNMKSNGKSLFLDHSKIYFFNFAGKKTVDLKEEIIQLIKEKITKEYEISTLKNDNDLVGILFYNHFNSYRYSELYNALVHINLKFSEISELYLNIAKNSRENMNQHTGIIVKAMFKEKSTLPKYAKDRVSIISSIQKESKLYYPKYDIAFANIFEMELINFAIKNNIFDKMTYINKLKDASESNLKYLDKTINQKSFFDENQIIILQQSHHNFLRKIFFDIIKDTYDGSVNLVYENLIDILESQILEDNEKLCEMFNKYKVKNEMRNLKFTDASKKGANYVIKEVETTREIEICIDSDEDFEKIMPQDF